MLGKWAKGLTKVRNEKHSLPAEKFSVLMIAPTSFFADYGCHVRILEEARVLQKLGHQVTIVTYYNGNSVPGINIERTLPIPWRKDYEVGSSRHKIGFDILLGFKTIQLLLTHHYDIIHGHLHEGALIGLALGQLFRKPVVFDFQGSLTGEMVDHGFLKPKGRLFNFMHWLETWIDQSASAILPSSAHAEKLLKEEFGCNPAKIHVLPDCVNTDVFKPLAGPDAAARSENRANLGIPGDAKVIVYLGLLTEYQGTTHLLQAFDRILSKHSDVYLLLMGFPVLPYHHKAQEMGIRDSVIMTGKIAYDTVPSYLFLGDVAVAPKISLTEGCGKLLNYMSMALPTVAFETPVAREYLGLNGIYAKCGDVEDLAEKLENCLYPENAAIQLTQSNIEATGLNLRQRAKSRFDWHKAGQQIEEIYTQLTDSHMRSDAEPIVTPHLQAESKISSRPKALQ